MMEHLVSDPEPSQRPVLYLVPDLTDPAVERRVAMLRAGGAEVMRSGFHRKPCAATLDVLPLGQTHDADLMQRMRVVMRQLFRPADLLAHARRCDMIIARNLEMLVLGWQMRILSGGRCRLVYESLDIHRSLLGTGLKTKLLTGLEGFLLRACDKLIVSSPAFLRHYFEPVHPKHPTAVLVENRFLALDPVPVARSPQGMPPWTIGWFGMIRCRESLRLLLHLTSALPDTVRVVIRGRPSPAVFPDLSKALEGQDAIRFEGPYAPQDLDRHYGEVDFVWGMDFYEAGQNSAWLLPNRLYEGGTFDRPLLAQSGVATADWLTDHDTGVVLSNPETDLVTFFQRLDSEVYDRLRARAAAVPRDALICDRNACRQLMRALFA